MITNCIMNLPSNCMVILKPPEESCPEPVLSLELAERAYPELVEGKGWHKTCLFSLTTSIILPFSGISLRAKVGLKLP